ncbi:glycosyltransferase family 4 protein [uncultured Thermomonas sp.]|uniref:glycosyltransferase family 4 protein n=1 Tax=uncultured Thermomonas sp. TaxID=318121 RepID=UPI002593A101|nr:glycosyltransferase family 4 protein [uncultured Thermomonas sp.]
MVERRPRILHITRNLPPLVGGMERLNWHIANTLSEWADVDVVGPQGAASLKPTSVALAEVPLRPLWRFLLASAWRALWLARTRKPNLVLAGSGLTAPAAWLAARACGARAAVYVHGLDVAVRHPMYRAIWHPILRRMDIVIANSQPTEDLVRALGVAEHKVCIVHPGVSLLSSPQPPEDLHDFRDWHALGDARLLLSIGRLTTRKGLREFVQNALPEIVKQASDTLLVIIGEAPSNALLAGVQPRDSIQAVADTAGIGSHVRFLGVITDPHALACAYESAAVHVFPVREIPGDPEGFGMVAIEAAAHGLPTVAFATGGIVDAVAEGRSGRLVPPGDYASLSGAVLQVLAAGDGASRAGAQQFASGFAWPLFGEKLRAALE